MSPKTLFFAILTVMLWGAAPLFDKVGLKKIPPFQAMILRNTLLVIFALTTFVFSSSFRDLFFTFPKQTLFLVIAGTLSGLVGQYTFYLALDDGKTSQVVPIASSFPLVTAVLSLFILGEPFTVTKSVGILLIVSGIYLVGSSKHES